MDKEISDCGDCDATLLEIQEDILEHVKSGGAEEVLIPLVKSLPHVNYFEVVNKREEWTPLHWAVATNQKQLCEILIQNGNADVNIMASNIPLVGDITNFAESPFMIACTPIISLDLFKLLLNNGADVQARGLVSMFSSLFHVVREPIELDLENIVNLDTQYKKLKLLLELNVDVKATSSDGMTCLHWFCPTINDENDREIAAEMFKDLIQRGADVNCRDVWGETPLSHACYNVNPTVIRLLLENGGDINVFGGIVGETFFHALSTMESNSCKDDFEECFRLLISAGVDINSRTFTGDAYLHNLCEENPSLCAVKMAVESGAEVDVRNCFGHTPLYTCLVFRDEYSYFDERNKTFCRNNLDEEREKVMEYLISKGGDISARDINGMTALVRAASKGLLDSVTFLLNRGANINSTDKCNRTALHHCVFQLNCFTDIKMVDTLISRGIDLNIKDNFGKTAAYYVNFLNEHNRKKFDLLRDKIDTNQNECMQQKYKENLAKQEELKKYLTIPKDGAADAAMKARENKQLIFELLQTPGVGSVAQLKDNFAIKTRVETLMKRLEKELSRSDSVFTYEAVVSGGVSEGTKVGLPDEFDYLLIVHGLLEDFVCDETETEPGFIRLRHNGNIDIRQSQVMTRVRTAEDASNQTSSDSTADLDACFQTSGYFDTAKFIRYFHFQVFKIMQKPCFWDDLDLYWMPLGYKLQGDLEREINERANFYVELQCPTEEIGELNISIDVVPVVRFPDTWPKDADDKAVSLIRSNQDNFCGVLMKAAGFKTKEATQIRLSTSLIEKNILQSSTRSLKEAFVLLKTLKNISSLQLSENSKFKVRTMFNTYDFKNAAIHYAAQYHEIKNGDATQTEIKRSEVCVRDTQTERSEAIAKHVRNITAFVNRESFFFPNAQISRQKVKVRDKSEDREIFLRYIQNILS